MRLHTELSFVDEFRKGFTPSLLTKRMTERCSSLVHIASGAAIFTLLLRRRVKFLHRTAICWPLFKPSVSLLSTYKTIELWFEFSSHFKVFHLTLPRRVCYSSKFKKGDYAQAGSRGLAFSSRLPKRNKISYAQNSRKTLW